MSLSLPSYPFEAFPVITTMGRQSIGLDINRLHNALPASVAWGTANQARYVPFRLPEPVTVVKLLAYNGATAAGNTDIGVYDAAGTEVISIAAAAQSGTSVWQEFDVTDTTLLPGLYYIGLLNTTTTGTYFGWANLQFGRAMGVFSQAVGAATLPSPSATFAALDAAVIPVVAMSTRTLL